jgi:hypothetical protein
MFRVNVGLTYISNVEEKPLTIVIDELSGHCVSGKIIASLFADAFIIQPFPRR